MASKARQAADEVNRQQAGRRNLIINGGFDVWQRGTSFNNIGSQYCADRFYYVRTHTVDVDRVSCSLDGFKYATKITNETAGVCKLYQYIENTGQFYEGQKLTLSFWVRASEVVTLRKGRTWDGSAYVTGYETFDTSTSWVRQTTTITVNSSWSGSESYFGVQVFGGHATNMSAGSWIEITGVQLEVGEVATPFEHRSYGEELALCQRYFWAQVPKGEAGGGAGNSAQYLVGIGSYLASTQIDTITHFPVEMRAAPSCTVPDITSSFVAEASGGNDYFNTMVGWGQKRQSSLLYCAHNGVSGTAGQAARVAAVSSTTYIHWDAEL